MTELITVMNLPDLLSVGGNLAVLGAVVKLLLRMDRRIVILETKIERCKGTHA